MLKQLNGLRAGKFSNCANLGRICRDLGTMA